MRRPGGRRGAAVVALDAERRLWHHAPCLATCGAQKSPIRSPHGARCATATETSAPALRLRPRPLVCRCWSTAAAPPPPRDLGGAATLATAQATRRTAPRQRPRRPPPAAPRTARTRRTRLGPSWARRRACWECFWAARAARPARLLPARRRNTWSRLPSSRWGRLARAHPCLRACRDFCRVTKVHAKGLESGGVSKHVGGPYPPVGAQHRRAPPPAGGAAREGAVAEGCGQHHQQIRRRGEGSQKKPGRLRCKHWLRAAQGFQGWDAEARRCARRPRRSRSLCGRRLRQTPVP